MASKDKMDGYLKKVDKYLEMGEDAILNADLKNKQNGSSGEKDKQSGTFWITIWLIAVILFILFTFVIENGWLLTILFGIASLILFVPAVYFGFAPKNLFFTINEEGTAKIVLKGGEFSHAIMRWAGYEFDDKWNIVPALALDHLLGGLRFYGIWPIYTVFSKSFRWQDIQLVQGEEKLLFHEKELDYVLVKPAIYGTDLKKTETLHPERIPIDTQFLISMRVVNPYKVFFNAPPNWNEKLLARLNAVFKGYIGVHTLDEMLSVKGNPKDIWDDLIANHQFGEVVKKFEDNWGVKIEENGVDLRDVDMPDEYQKAGAAEKRMELEAAGVASQTVGMIIASMAQSYGKPVSEIGI